MQSKLMMRLLFLFLAFSLSLFATEGKIGGKIKIFVKSTDAIYTSQKVTVSVELLSNAFSITDAKITFPASKKYIVQTSKSAAYLGQEKVEGEQWQMVHYDYEVYALQAGKIEIPSVSVTFTASMGYGQPKKEFILQSENLTFNVNSPEGVKANTFVLVTDDFALNTVFKPEKKTLIVGDAVSLRVIQKAKGVPDILLIPIVYTSNALLRVYKKEPLLKSGLKGAYDVSRTDSFTFVASGEGNVTLPAQEILWWNSTTKKVQKENIPETRFKIIADPKIALDAQKAKEKKFVLIVGIVILILLLLYHFASPAFKKYLMGRKHAYENSEKGKFDQLIQSVEEGTVPDIYSHFYAWLASIDNSIHMTCFKDIYVHYPEFKDRFIAFESILISNNSFDKSSAEDTLKSLRTALLKDKTIQSNALERRLNP